MNRYIYICVVSVCNKEISPNFKYIVQWHQMHADLFCLFFSCLIPEWI